MKILSLTFILLIVLHTSIAAQLETGHPKIEFLEPTTFDFGKVIGGEKVSHTFKFKNTGNADLEIYLVKTSCRCTASLLSNKIIKPGAAGELQVAFSSAGYIGKVIRTTDILSNDPENPRIKVTLTGDVEGETTNLTASAIPMAYHRLTLLYAGNEHGELEPCGCAEGQSGGFTHQATLVEAERQNTSGGFLLLGVGDTFGLNESHYKLRAELAMSAMNEMGYDALVLGEREFAFGKSFIQQQMNESEFPIIAANIIDESTREPFASAPYILKDVGGIKVGIIGVMNGSYLPDERWQQLGLRVSDPKEAIKKALKEIRPISDLIIVLGHLGLSEAAVLAQTVSGIDVVITAHGNQSITKPLKAGRAYIAMNDDKEQSIRKLEIWLNEEKQIVGLEGSAIPITDSVEMHPKIAKLISEYKTKLRELPIEPINETNEKYVTSEACRKCHEDASQVWQASKHADAFQTLKARNNQYDPECLKCHTTGYRLSTGFLSIDETLQYKDVHCEACHGPGEGHVANPTEAYGKVQVTSLCSSCHTPERSPSFHHAYWRLIQH